MAAGLSPCRSLMEATPQGRSKTSTIDRPVSLKQNDAKQQEISSDLLAGSHRIVHVG